MLKEILLYIFLACGSVFYICIIIGAIGYVWEMIFHPENIHFDDEE